MKRPRIIQLSDGTRTVEATGPDALRGMLTDLEVRLRAAGFDPDRLFLPGLPESEVRAQFSSVGLEAPDEIVTFYHWHNGQTAAGFANLPLAEISIAPLENVIASYRANRRLIGGFLGMDAPLIILEADTIGHAVVCDQPAGVPPLVLEFFEENAVYNRTQPVGRSLCTWVASWILAIDVGRWVASGPPEDRHWTFDPGKYAEWKALGALS